MKTQNEVNAKVLEVEKNQKQAEEASEKARKARHYECVEKWDNFYERAETELEILRWVLSDEEDV